jgi:quercetin dioxygenase-like cupin family protein
MADAHLRALDAPLMSFDIEDEIAKIKAGSQWKTGTRTAVTLVKNAALTIVLVAVHKGGTVHEHRAEGPITVAIADGAVRFRASGHEHRLQRGALLALGADIPHEVEADEDSAFVVTVVQPR